MFGLKDRDQREMPIERPVQRAQAIIDAIRKPARVQAAEAEWIAANQAREEAAALLFNVCAEVRAVPEQRPEGYRQIAAARAKVDEADRRIVKARDALHDERVEKLVPAARAAACAHRAELAGIGLVAIDLLHEVLAELAAYERFASMNARAGDVEFWPRPVEIYDLEHGRASLAKIAADAS